MTFNTLTKLYDYMINLGRFTVPKEAMYSLVVTSGFFPVYPT